MEYSFRPFFHKSFSLFLTAVLSLQPLAAAEVPLIGASTSKMAEEKFVEAQNTSAKLAETLTSEIVASSTEFLEDARPLSAPKSNGRKEAADAATETGTSYDYERYSFEDALEYLRPEYAAAVILESITAEQLKKLTEVDFEVGVAILHDEIVLFTSGNKNEIYLNSPALDILSESTLFAHTHPFAHQDAGPSQLDLEHAGEDREYVITETSVYQYQKNSLVTQISHKEFAELLMSSRGRDAATQDRQVQARNVLNRFIASMDRLNQASEENRLVFRSGGEEPDFIDSFDRSSLGADWQAEAGNWSISNGRLYHGYSSDSKPGIITFNNSPESGDYDFGATFEYTSIYSDYRGLVARYQDSNNYYYAYVHSYQGEFFIGKVKDGVRSMVARGHVCKVTGTTCYEALQTYTPYRIRMIADGDNLQLYLDDVLLTEAQDGDLESGAAGIYSGVKYHYMDDFSLTVLNREFTLQRPDVNELREYTSSSQITLSGNKEPGKGIWVNGEMKVAPDDQIQWEVNIPLPAEAVYSFDVQAGSSEGERSAPVTVQTTFRQPGPDLYFEYFDENNLGSDWAVKHGNWSIAEGVLQHQYSSPDPRGWITLESYLGGSDIEMEADFYIPAGTTRTEAGFLARYLDEQNYYYAYVEKSYNYRTFKIIKYVGGKYYQIASSGSHGFNWQGKSYHLDLTVEGNQLNFYFDGILALSVADVSLAEGKAGLRSYSSGDTIDNFKAKVLGAVIVPVDPPVINTPVPSYVSESMLTLSGTHSAGTSVWINGELASQISETEWSHTVSLQPEGQVSQLEILARDAFGNASNSITVETILDQTKPHGEVTINGGQAFSYEREAVLTFFSNDTLSGVEAVRYSLDGIEWTAWHQAVQQTTVSLLGEEGTKTVYYEVRDKAGNTASFSDAIGLLLPDHYDGFDETALRTEWLSNHGSFETRSGNLYLAYHYPVSLPAVLALNQGFDTQNYDVSADFYFDLPEPQESMGIVSRFQGPGDFYYGVVHGSGHYRILKFLNGTALTLASGQLNEPLTADVWHQVRFITNDDSLKLYLDGDLLIEAFDNEFKDGKNGLGAALSARSMDNFALKLLPPSISAPVVTVNALESIILEDSVTLRGTRTPGTSVWINGASVVPAGENENWEYEFTFPSDGPYPFEVHSETEQGVVSETVSTATTHLIAVDTIFQDAFDSALLSSDWIIKSGGWKTNEGRLLHQGFAGVFSSVVLDPAKFSLPSSLDIEASFYYSHTASGNNRGILAGYQDSQNYYRAELRGNGTYFIVRRFNGAETVLASGWIGRSVEIGVAQDLHLQLRNGKLRLFLNGNFLVEAVDGTFSGGTAGLFSHYSNSNGENQTIDNFSITKVPVARPYVFEVPEKISSAALTIRGLKDPETSIWIDGLEVVPADGLTEWSYEIPSALEEGKRYNFAISAKDSLGNESLSVEKAVYREISDLIAYLVNGNMSYFRPEWGMVEAESGYPFEGWARTDYTQPTAIGFYALLLANVISGSLVTEHMSVEQASSALEKLSGSLLRDQAAFGYKGLLPWMGFENGVWGPRTGTPEGQKVITGDNVNLSAALGNAIGALLVAPSKDSARVAAIRANLETFLDKQEEGYRFLYDAGTGKMRRGYDFVNNWWVAGDQAYHDFLGDEFRSGLLFISLRYGLPESIYAKLRVAIQDYTMADGTARYVLSPYDGGAFQILWPLLLMPEYDIPGFRDMHETFVDIALDFSTQKDLPGFLSASYIGLNQYAGNAGMTDLSSNPAPRNETTASLYTLGAAYRVRPEAVKEFMTEILYLFPDAMSEHGLWEGIKPDGQIIEEQISSNVMTFLLGLAGTGQDYMRIYLQNKDLEARFLEIAAAEGQPADIIADNSYVYLIAKNGTFNSSINENDGTLNIAGDSFRYLRFLLNQYNINLSGRKLRIRYSSNEAINLQLVFRYGTSASDHAALTLPLVLEDTGGEEKELLIDLLATPALAGISSVDLTFSTSQFVAVNLAISALEVI